MPMDVTTISITSTIADQLDLLLSQPIADNGDSNVPETIMPSRYLLDRLNIDGFVSIYEGATSYRINRSGQRFIQEGGYKAILVDDIRQKELEAENLKLNNSILQYKNEMKGLDRWVNFYQFLSAVLGIATIMLTLFKH